MNKFNVEILKYSLFFTTSLTIVITVLNYDSLGVITNNILLDIIVYFLASSLTALILIFIVKLKSKV